MFKINMDSSFVCLIVILIFLDFSTALVVESNDTATWEEARVKCQQNGQLASFLDVSSDPELQSGEFWFAGVQALSPWVWMRGCFNKTLLKKNPVDANLLSAGTCALKCNNSPYFALGNVQLCYCLNETEVQTNFNENMKISSEHCQLCGNDICGEYGDSGESVFLYQKYAENTFQNMEQESDKNLRCATINYNEGNPENSIFLMTDCNENHWGDCTNILGRTFNITRMTWLETLQHCQKQSSYPTVDQDTNWRLLLGVRFWIGLYREDANILDDRINMTRDLTITSCLYLKHADGELRVPLKSDCNVRRRYICHSSDERVNMTSPSIDTTNLDISDNTDIVFKMKEAQCQVPAQVLIDRKALQIMLRIHPVLKF